MNRSVKLSRRRLILVSACAAGVGVLPRPGRAQVPVARWTGVALGAGAELRLVGVTPAEAGPVFAAIEAELARCEAIFSLYREDSQIAQLNRDGRLDDPAPEMLALLTQARAVHRRTGGLFDPTVQPLFDLYARHAARGTQPAQDQLRQALDHVGFDRLRFDAGGVMMPNDMRLTLNGIAQGAITDRVAALLHAEGLHNVLVDMGEIRGQGGGPDGQGWPVRLDHGAVPVPGQVLRGHAVATSCLVGTMIGGVGHILHPRLGAVPPRLNAVSVVAGSAALADGLSTGAALMDVSDARDLAGDGISVIAS